MTGESKSGGHNETEIMGEENDTPRCVAVISDLMFRSKVREIWGTRVTFVGSVETLRDLLPSRPSLWIIDGNNSKIPLAQCAPDIVAHARASGARVVCYAAHVDVPLFEEAERLGITEVMPRSQFVKVLEEYRAPQEPALSSQRGASAITLLVFGVLISAGLFYCYKVFPFYYYYYELVNQLEASVRAADVLTDADIRRNIKRTIRETGIPTSIDALIIERRDKFIRLQLSYREVFYIRWRGKDYDLQVFDFVAKAEGKF